MNDEFEGTYLSTPPFSSPNPKTEGLRMLPLEDGTSAHQSAVEAAGFRDAAKGSDYRSMKVADLKKLAQSRELEPASNKKDDLVAALLAADGENLNAADFIEKVNSATTQEELDAAADLYEASGNQFSTVEDAIDKKQDELDQSNVG